ncbi:MAG TPA: protein phosphatase CheZ [Noviherbaspirillum sp.]|uniref:protein phosphatase CheZ n=1 Tax=Noviherbaspirillum sp. TaxID=1926288 RepID=UPI002D5B1B01|nr:protein phosphatase CheZ [Noviherbaspirillum sp.]HYD95668.1 protein phosphatase CheZ [Noviherbaspirillum sp.]
MNTAWQQAKAEVDNFPQEEMLARVGQMTRTLHDNLRGLGFDKLIAKAAHDIPDARDRLDYVARMTEQAAQRVLTATELASPIQDKIEAGADDIAQSWQSALQASFSEAQYRALAERTVAFLDEARGGAIVTKQQLLDIMMAQDFQDLTGQVIKKVTELAHNIEQQLVQLLVDYAPAEVRRETNSGLLNGPQINPTASADVVSSQGQVDDLLESLGF